MWPIGTGHKFLIESWGFKTGRGLQVNSSSVPILQKRKQRPGKTAWPCSLAECGPLIPSGNKSYLILFPLQTQSPKPSCVTCVTPSKAHHYFFFPCSPSAQKHIYLCIHREVNCFHFQSSGEQMIFLLPSRTQGRAQKPLSLASLDHPNTSGLMWSLDRETKLLHILVQFQRGTALFGGYHRARGKHAIILRTSLFPALN